jgi:hypothetical protein
MSFDGGRRRQTPREDRAAPSSVTAIGHTATILWTHPRRRSLDHAIEHASSMTAWLATT